MASERWRFIESGALDGADNMALDGALHRLAEERLAAGSAVAPVLRFYGWSPPAVSIGRHQVPSDACDLDACRVAGVDVVRRATGGRAVLHDDELTYALVAPAAGAFAGAGVSAAVTAISGALVEGLRGLGLEVGSERGRVTESPRVPRIACFAAASRCEITSAGRKLLGSAQARGRAAFLQHGSLPLGLDTARHAELLGCPPESLAEKATSLERALGRRPDADELAAALRRGFETALSVTLEVSELDDEERAAWRTAAAALRDDPHRWLPAGGRPEAA